MRCVTACHQASSSNTLISPSLKANQKLAGTERIDHQREVAGIHSFIHSDGRRRRGPRAAALAEVGEHVGAPVDGRLVGGGILDAVHARWVATLVQEVQALALRRVLPVADAAVVAARP